MSKKHAQPLSPVPPPVLLTLQEAMSYLRVSRSTLYRLMESGQLVGSKVGGTWRFSQQELQACLRRVRLERSSPSASTSAPPPGLVLKAGPFQWSVRVDGTLQRWSLDYPYGHFPESSLQQQISYQGRTYRLVRVWTNTLTVSMQQARHPAKETEDAS